MTSWSKRGCDHGRRETSLFQALEMMPAPANTSPIPSQVKASRSNCVVTSITIPKPVKREPPIMRLGSGDQVEVARWSAGSRCLNAEAMVPKPAIVRPIPNHIMTLASSKNDQSMMPPRIAIMAPWASTPGCQGAVGSRAGVRC